MVVSTRNHIQRAYGSPERDRIQGAVGFNQALRKQYGFDPLRTKCKVYQHFGVPYRSGTRLISENNRDRRHFEPGEDPRSRPLLVETKDIYEMERILEEQDVYGRTMSWEALGYEAGLYVSGRTIERAMGTKDYRRCVACNKAWIFSKPTKKRVDWATLMKARYPTKYTWRKVRFSDESRAGHGPQGKLVIIRRKGERRSKEDAKKKVHVWGAAGYDFKSDLITYNIPSNRQDDPTREWKAQNGLKHYFNCASSLDLAIIENCFQPMKQHVRKYTHCEPDETQELLKEG
ncbi:hypothetical protein P152DRAFT_504951 [Eremomyces bilateralis CBS 781.70]|uniref:Tc1-like transposase DDE domain-containing protein n=1 Tax=Eremomyces bilateralis CBS 781.70 TaxID=1392243 RepID=A0A6G1GE93_9PEZI|nr:uncharacterized protein P152DRAFT_504951 [Eremomyces bilateralis CBS 781.70]KAF1816226.1 hypothetical protein P152DRAFT_504951 [Eremomyces bilateralis CBS 781.70]